MKTQTFKIIHNLKRHTTTNKILHRKGTTKLIINTSVVSVYVCLLCFTMNYPIRHQNGVYSLRILKRYNIQVVVNACDYESGFIVVVREHDNIYLDIYHKFTNHNWRLLLHCTSYRQKHIALKDLSGAEKTFIYFSSCNFLLCNT